MERLPRHGGLRVSHDGRLVAKIGGNDAMRRIHAAATAEGLTLVRADNATGFKGVYRYRGVEPWRPKPFKSTIELVGNVRSYSHPRRSFSEDNCKAMFATKVT